MLSAKSVNREKRTFVGRWLSCGVLRYRAVVRDGREGLGPCYDLATAERI
jgi:hypothetical protein